MVIGPGSRLGIYEIEAPVGRGGMGVVYRARDLALGRTVAIKVLETKSEEDADALPRFVREGRLAASITHPNVVAIYDVAEFEGQPFIAMEWVDGVTLRELLDRRTLRASEMVEILLTLAEVLAYTHARGIIHRDLKPANVLVDREGRTKLLDFGIAKQILDPTGATLSPTFVTADDLVLGTPKYMAPEQWLSSAVDARADQFAWGVIAYEMFAGIAPGTLPPDPREVERAVPPAVSAVVTRALARVAAARFADMTALVDAFRTAVGGAAPPTLDLAALAPNTPVSAPPVPPPSRGLFVLALACGASIAAAAGVLTFLFRARPPSVETRVAASASTMTPASASPLVPGGPSASVPEAATAVAATRGSAAAATWATRDVALDVPGFVAWFKNAAAGQRSAEEVRAGALQCFRSARVTHPVGVDVRIVFHSSMRPDWVNATPGSRDDARDIAAAACIERGLQATLFPDLTNEVRVRASFTLQAR